MAYLRYKRQFNIVVDEYKNCDVIGLNDTSDFIEVEIKTSFADLKNDKKKPKHTWYGELKSRKFKPGKFFFMVPEELFEKVKPYVDEHFPYAGIMVWKPGKNKGRKFVADVKVKKHAKDLNSKKLTDKQFKDLLKRLVSSIVISKLKLI